MSASTVWGLALFGGFGVDGDAEDLREALFDTVFEGGGYVVDASDGKIALHDAVAGDESVVLDLADAHIVAIEKLVKLAGQGVQEKLDSKFQAMHFANTGIGSGDVAAEGLDVNVHVGIAIS